MSIFLLCLQRPRRHFDRATVTEVFSIRCELGRLGNDSSRVCLSLSLSQFLLCAVQLEMTFWFGSLYSVQTALWHN